MAAALVIAGCGPNSPTPAVTANTVRETPAASGPPASAIASNRPSPSSSQPTDLSALRWYEVLRVHDLEGKETRSLLFGSLDGTFGGELALGQIQFEERRAGSEPFAWIDPQADGVFDGHALVWGRDNALGRLEQIDLASGELRTLVDSPDVIHRATANASLTRLFFITATAGGEPTGLWFDDLDDDAEPTRLAYDFGTEPIHNFSKLRLVAAADGSLVAVQREDGPVVLIDVERDRSDEVSAGGPVVGFADNYLVTLGTQSADGTYPIVAFDVTELAGSIVFRSANSAQVVPGDRTVAAMSVEGNSYEIHAVQVDRGDGSLVYRGTVGTNPLLARRDRTFVGYEAPPDTVLLVESFTRFIGDPPQGRELPPSAYPLLLNLLTGQATSLGPWD